jgi:hypothetical protein
LGCEAAREEKVFQVMRLMIGNNHPVGSDGGIKHVSQIMEGGLSRWFQESIMEDLLEALGWGIFGVEGQMQEDTFFIDISVGCVVCGLGHGQRIE